MLRLRKNLLQTLSSEAKSLTSNKALKTSTGRSFFSTQTDADKRIIYLRIKLQNALSNQGFHIPIYLISNPMIERYITEFEKLKNAHSEEIEKEIASKGLFHRWADNRSTHDYLNEMWAENYNTTIETMNSFEKVAFICTKEHGVKAEDIFPGSIVCEDTRDLFIKLIQKYKLQANEALAEISDLTSKDFHSIQQDYLHALNRGYRRRELDQLLNEESISKVDNDPHLKALFRSKLYYIMSKKDNSLFYLLKPLSTFTQLHKEVLDELHDYSKIRYDVAIKKMQFYSEDKLLRIRVYKFRRLAEKLTNRFIDDFLWCTSENHARAFATLINKHCVSYEDTIKILKNIQQKNEIECIALGATHTESKHMNPIQRYCFVQFNLISSESLPFVRYKKS